MDKRLKNKNVINLKDIELKWMNKDVILCIF